MTPLPDRAFWIDGGAMFGMVPRVIWARLTPPDDLNRIRLTTNCVLLERGGDALLIEAGIGDALPDKARKHLNLQPGITLLDRLRDEGVRPEEVRRVVLTHLNFDHNGWCTRPDGRGGFVPTFPRADYVVQQRQLEQAAHPTRRERGSYLPQTIEPVQRAGLWKPVQGAAEVAPGVQVLPTDGHCPGHQVVLFEEAGRTWLYPGDLVPTTHHLGPAYGMAFDSDPEVVVKQKQHLLTRACDEGWHVVWCHDLDRPVTRVMRDARGAFVSSD